MKTLKPKLEVLEGRALLAGLWDPGPGGTPLPTEPLGMPILAGKSDTDNINFESPRGAVQVGDEVVFLDQDHWERGGFEDLDDIPGAKIVDLIPDDQPDPPAPGGGGGGGGGGGILGWLGNLFGGGKNKDSESADAGPDYLAAVDMVFSGSASGLDVPPDVDLPGPAPETQETMVRPPSRPMTVADLFHNPYDDISLTPGGTTITSKSSDHPAPGVGGTTWQPGPNIFYNPRAPQGGSGISIEFVSAGVVDPRNKDTVYVVPPRDAETPIAVSVPDGGTMLLGGVKASPKSVTLVEVLTAAKGSSPTLSVASSGRRKTVDNDEKITIGGVKSAQKWATDVDAFFGRLGQQASGLFADASVRQIQAQPTNGIIAILIHNG